MHLRRLTRALCALACLLALGACKEVLFSNLDETEANEMVAVLAAAGVASTRTRDKDNVYEILVETAHIPVATTLLRSNGYPRPKFASLGDVFSNEGIVGTPFEQHARYIYAMNEELSHTISSIDGITSARVFVTSPPKDRYASAAPQASASVTINYEPGFDIQGQVSKIKNLISHSLANLSYDNVAVALFQSSGPTVQVREQEIAQNYSSAKLLRIALLAPDAIARNSVVVILAVTSILLGLLLIWFYSPLAAALGAKPAADRKK